MATPKRIYLADPGTVYEVGYMIGQGKPAFGFTLDSRHYRERAVPPAWTPWAIQSRTLS